MNIPSLKQSSGRAEFILIVVLALLTLLVVLSRTEIMTMDHERYGLPHDHNKYIIMADENPFDFHIAPYCWRFAWPLIVKALPFDLQTSFFMMTFMFLWFAGIAVYYMLKAYGFDQVYSLIGMLFYYTITWAVKWLLYDFWLSDAMSFFVIILIFYALFARNDKLYIAMLIVGVTVKESIIFTVPLYYTLNTDSFWNLKLIKKTFVYALPAVVVLLLIRYFIPEMNYDVEYLATLDDKFKIVQDGKSDYSYVDYFLAMGAWRIKTFGWAALSEYTEGSFGFILVVLPLFGLWVKRNLMMFVKFLPFLALVYFSLFFADNTERLLAAASPAIIVLAMNGVKKLVDSTFLKPWHFIVLSFIMLAYNMIGVRSYTPLSIDVVIRNFNSFF